LAVGRSDGGSHRPGHERRIWFARRAAATAQRQGHAGAVSSQFVDRAPSHRARRRRRRAKTITTVKLKKIKYWSEGAMECWYWRANHTPALQPSNIPS